MEGEKGERCVNRWRECVGKRNGLVARYGGGRGRGEEGVE